MNSITHYYCNKPKLFILYYFTTIMVYWTGKTFMFLPGKELKGHICPTIVTTWWHHSDVI